MEYRQNSAIWGLPPRFSIRDLPNSYQSTPTAGLTQVAVTTLSPAIDIGCRGVQLVVALQSGAVTCDIELYKNDGVTLVYKFVGVTWSNLGQLYAGSNEGVNLHGLPFKIKVVNPVGGWVTVGVQPTY